MVDFVAMRYYRVNRPDVVMESFEGELVLVQMKSGNYYSLQGSAPLIWELIDRGLPSKTPATTWLHATGMPGKKSDVRCTAWWRSWSPKA